MLLGMPVAMAFLVTNIVAAVDLFMGGAPGIAQVINNGFGAMTNFALVPIPMFLLMGELFYYTGLAARCFNAADKLMGNVPRPPCLRDAHRRHGLRRARGLVDGRLRAAWPADGAGDDPARLQQVPVDRADHGRRRPRGDHSALGARGAARDARPDRRRRAAHRRHHAGIGARRRCTAC